KFITVPRTNAGEFITQLRRYSRTPENSSQCPRTNSREFIIQHRRYLRTPENSSQCPRTNTGENSPHNAEGVQEHQDKHQRIHHMMPKVFKNKHQRIHHSAKSAQGQMSENLPQCQRCSRTNTKEFITVPKVPKDKCRRIHYTIPKVFKNKHQRIHQNTESAQKQTPENSLHNAKGVQEQIPENSS
ncbi:49_t:CDS:2, partial [Dentiscutata heterogama]